MPEEQDSNISGEIEEPYSNISGEIRANVTAIENCATGQPARQPIADAIRKMANESEDLLTDLKTRVSQSEISNLSTASDTFFDTASQISNILATLGGKEASKQAITYALNGFAKDPTLVVKQTTGDKRADLPNIGWDAGYQRWAFRRSAWPTFHAFHIEAGNADSVEYKIGNGQTNIIRRDFLRTITINALAADYTDVNNPLDENGKYQNPIVGSSYDYNFNRLNINLPIGPQGTLDNAIFYRPFLTRKVWTNADVSKGYSTGSIIGRKESTYDSLGNVLEAGNEDPNMPMDGAIVIFQKTAVRENSSEAKTASNRTKKGIIYVPGTDSVLLSDNWDWNLQTSVFIPRGGKALASIVDGKGNKFTREIYWGSRSNFKISWTETVGSRHYNYTDQVPEDFEPGRFVLGGGRINGTYGYDSGSHGMGEEYIGLYMYGSDRFYLPYGPLTSTESKLNWHLTAAKLFMVPVSIIGVYFQLSHENDTKLRGG